MRCHLNEPDRNLRWMTASSWQCAEPRPYLPHPQIGEGIPTGGKSRAGVGGTGLRIVCGKQGALWFEAWP